MWVYPTTSESDNRETVPTASPNASLPRNSSAEGTEPSAGESPFRLADEPPSKRKHTAAHARGKAAAAVPLPHPKRSVPSAAPIPDEKNMAAAVKNPPQADFARSVPFNAAPPAKPHNAQSAANGQLLQAVTANSRTGPLFFFAALYALGAAASGVFRALLGADELLFLQKYVQAVQSSFLSAQPFALFSQLFLSAFIPVTLVLIFSLCAFGVPLIASLLALSGMGAGFVVIQLILENGTDGLLFYILLMGLYNAFVACSLCLLGRPGAAVASDLFRAVIHPNKNPKEVSGKASTGRIPQLLRCYVYLLVLIALLCGLCAAFSGIAGMAVSL